MLKSLYSGIAGLKVNQQKLDVIGNNVANVGTTAFKGSSVNFQDMLSQSVSSSQGASQNLGGINGNQVGSGVKIGTIAVNQTQGNMMATGNDSDVAINGNGYFMVEAGPALNGTTPVTVDPVTHLVDPASASTAGASISYTRDGSFGRDDQGNLITASGLKVLGYSVKDASTESIQADGVHFVNVNVPYTATGTDLKTLVIPDSVTLADGTTSKITKISIDNNGVVTANLANTSTTVIGQIAMASFNNTAGLKDLGGNVYQDTTNSGIAIIKSGYGAAKADDNSGGGAYGTMNSGSLEASNVDLAQQFTDMIVTTRAFEANGKTISNGDEILQTIIGLKR